MKRHAHMVDLLRPTLTLSEQVDILEHKQELTIEDLDMIIEKAELVMLAAVAAKRIKRNLKKYSHKLQGL